jgi:predicted permease
MPKLSRLYRLCRNLFSGNRMEQELTEEIDAYLEMLIEHKIKDGLNPEEARRAALIQLGGKERVKERVREVSVGHNLEALWQDLRYGLRMLRKNPGFTAIALLTLSLGIGANAAIFSVVYGVLLQPLPYSEDDRLVTLIQSYPQKGLDTWGISQANFALYRDRNHVFEKIAAYSPIGFNLTGGVSPERLQAAAVTVDFFDVLGIQPAWGRSFLPEEDTPGKNLVCILSYSLWQRRFGGDLQMLGKPLLLNNVPAEVVGIMPPGFAYPNRNVELWLPVGLNPQRLFPYTLIGIARLKPAIQVSQAEAETTDIFWNAAQENPATAGATAPPPSGADMKTIIRPLKDVIVGETKTPLLVLLGAVGLVLLIACANVASLLMARAASRTREFAFRFALGASPGRIIRQLLTESLLLGLVGGVMGATLAWLGVRLLRQLPALQQVPRLEEVSVNATVLVFTAALSVLTGLLFGLAPALQTYRMGLQTGIREGMRGSANTGSRRLNRVLVSAQFALCLVLLISAGLLLKSFQRLLSVSPGFQPEHVLSMRLALPNSKYANDDQSAQFYESLLERVRSLPGIRSAGVVSYLPFGGSGESDGFVVEGHEPDSGGVAPNAQIRVVSPGYLQTLEIPLLHGRDFLSSDRADSPPVAIVDDTLARRFWADGDAIGKRIRFSWSDQWMMIVGVTAGVKNRNLRETVMPHLYYPHAQGPSRQMYLTARTVAEPTTATAAIRNEVQALDSDLPVWKVQPLTEAVGQTLNNHRLTNTLLTVFAVLAVLLAAVGIYGVMSLYVNNRTKEFGIRLALGAQPAVLLGSVLRQGLALALTGVLVGTTAAVALTRMLASLLYEVSATDPIIFFSVPLLLVAVALLACYIPGRRAMRVDPLVALRYE